MYQINIQFDPARESLQVWILVSNSVPLQSLAFDGKSEERRQGFVNREHRIITRPDLGDGY